MKKVSFKKLSILGLVLMGASAVTAAIIPSKAKDHGSDNGSLRVLSNTDPGGPNGIISCFDDNDDVDSCTATVSGTTVSGNDSFDGDGLQTKGANGNNTSQTGGTPLDQTSLVS